MPNVIPFKDNNAQFKDWLETVMKVNFETTSPKSAMLIYEDPETGLASSVRYNVDLKTMEWFGECVNDKVQELKIDKYLREHIGDYIEYIE